MKKNKVAMIIDFNGKTPHINDGVFIAPNAAIIGDVQIGRDSSVWFGAVIRADIARVIIGERSNIQDNSVIHVSGISRHTMTVGNDVTIGHSAILHSCVIKDRVLIGMGSIILDDAVIGEDSIVGAGSLVTKGKEFPPRSLIIGSPAKIVRTLNDDEIDEIRRSSAVYTDIKNLY